MDNLWSRPANTKQQERQVRQRLDAALISPDSAMNVQLNEAGDRTVDAKTPATVVQDDVFMPGDDEPEDYLCDAACDVNSDDERMADDMLVDLETSCAPTPSRPSPPSPQPIPHAEALKVVVGTLNYLFSFGDDDVGFDELLHRLGEQGSPMAAEDVVEILDEMEVANQVMLREGRVHLI